MNGLVKVLRSALFRKVASKIAISQAPSLSNQDVELENKQIIDLSNFTTDLNCSEYKFDFEEMIEKELLDSLRVDEPIFYYHSDHLGTNTVISNSVGSIHQYFYNLPFGETMIERCFNSSFPIDYKFNGKELDVESGLYYYGARYYDPRISVWLSVDPLAEKYPMSSGYNYVLNNPFKYIDPSGMKIKSFKEAEESQWQETRKLIFSNSKYKKVQEQVLALEASDEVFTIRMGENVSSDEGGGNFKYNSETGEFDLNINNNSDFDINGRIAHEIKHADQYLNKKIGFRLLSDKIVKPWLYDRADEREAFEQQSLFDGKISYFTIEEMLDNRYGYLTNYKSNLGISDIESNELREINNANKQYQNAGKSPRWIYNGWDEN